MPPDPARTIYISASIHPTSLRILSVIYGILSATCPNRRPLERPCSSTSNSTRPSRTSITVCKCHRLNRPHRVPRAVANRSPPQPGSFGTHPKQIQKILQSYQSLAESRPDPFLRYEQPFALDTARSAIADYLRIPLGECVFVKNATTGVNTVLRNLSFAPGDVIIYFDTVYGAVGKTIQSLEETTPVKGRKVCYEFPITHEELVGKFVETVKKVKAEGCNARVAVFETVVSVPGILFPWEELVAVCKREGVLSLVDGAHGVGMLKLDLGSVQPDFFTSNCHKYVSPSLALVILSVMRKTNNRCASRWLYTPRSSAILYVPTKNQHLIRTTLPTSWGFLPACTPESEISPLTGQPSTKTRFEQLFQFVATADDSPYLCVPAALEFREKVCGGEDKIFAYLDQLANEGGDIVAEALGTEVLQEAGLGKGGKESKWRRSAMVNVRLPVSLGEQKEGACVLKEERDVQAAMKWIGETLIWKYGTFVPVFKYGGWLWTRLSAQVYLEKNDFVWMGEVLKEMCAKVRKGEMD